MLSAYSPSSKHPVWGHDEPSAVHVHWPGLYPPGHAWKTSQNCSAATGQGSDWAGR